MTVQEPNDIDKSTIDQHGVENFAAIVYEKSQDNPGLKQLGLADLKSVFDYNSRKADNVARLCGFPKDAEADSNCYDYKDGDVTIPEDGTLLSQIRAVAANAGVGVTQSSPLNPLGPRLEKVETNLGTLETSPTKTLMERMHEAENDISDLAAEIGGGGSGGTPLTNRVELLEGTVNGEGGNPGLSDKVADLETAVNGDGGSNPGLSADVAQLKTEVEDGTIGLLTKVTNLETEVGANTGTGSLNERVAQNETDINELKTTAAAAYKFQGSLDTGNVPDWQTRASQGEFKNGYVWDCLDELIITFNGKEYHFSKGTNFVYVGATPPDSDTRLDELGVSFDTSAITDRLTNLENKFYNNGSTTVSNWTSDGLNGTYLISGYKKAGANVTSFAFIAMLDGQGALMTNLPIDLGGTFDTLFELDSIYKIKLKSTISLNQLNTLKLS